MAEVKKDEPATNPVDSKAKKDSPAKSNPFETYKSLVNTPADDKKDLSKQKESPSSKSPSSYSHSSRSRSRDEKPRQSKGQTIVVPSARGAPSQPDMKSGKGQDANVDVAGKQGESHTEEAYFKTKMCPLYDKGACKKGSTCNFAHGERELRGLPNFRKTRLCIPFKNGECPKSSSECKYAHGEAEIRKLAYDYFPEKNQGHYRRFQKTERSHDRGHQRGQRDDHYHRGSREQQRPYRDSRDSRDRRDFEGQRDRRDYRGDRDYRNRPRQRQQEYRYSQDTRDNKDNRDRYKEERDRYNVEYQLRGPEMYPPPASGYGYMPGYNSAYMIPPGMGGYSNAGQMYASSSGTGQASGFGQGAPSSSFSGSGHGMSSSGSYGSYNYGYGFVPQSYPYNPSSV